MTGLQKEKQRQEQEQEQQPVYGVTILDVAYEGECGAWARWRYGGEWHAVWLYFGTEQECYKFLWTAKPTAKQGEQ